MGARERASAQSCVARQCLLLDQLADRAEAAILELAHVEMTARCRILRPAQEHVARGLHHALALDHALTRVARELRPETLEHGLVRFLDLQEQGRAVVGHEQADGAEGAHAADADHLEGHVLERIAIDQAKMLGREPLLIGGEHLLGVDAFARIFLRREVIDQRRPVLDMRLLARDEVRKIVVLLELSFRLGEDRIEPASQRAIRDAPDLVHQVDSAVPDLERRELGERAHPGPVGFHRYRGSRARAFLGIASRQPSDRHARGQPLEVRREVDPRQGLVEIVDVEDDVFLGRGERAEVHQVAIAACLYRDAGGGLMLEVVGHHGRGAAQEGERARGHALIAHRHELGHARAVGGGEDFDRIARRGPEQVGVLLARRLPAQSHSVIVTFSEGAGCVLSHVDLSHEARRAASADGRFYMRRQVD